MLTDRASKRFLNGARSEEILPARGTGVAVLDRVIIGAPGWARGVGRRAGHAGRHRWVLPLDMVDTS